MREHIITKPGQVVRLPISFGTEQGPVGMGEAVRFWDWDVESQDWRTAPRAFRGRSIVLQAGQKARFQAMDCVGLEGREWDIVVVCPPNSRQTHKARYAKYREQF